MFTKCIRRKKVPIAISILLLGNILYADISGIVYTDFNLNGVKDTNDVILKGVTVNAICEDENTYTSATNDNGEYTLSGLPSGKYCRVEADPSSQGLDSASNSTGSNPLVDRVEDGTTDHDISVASAGTYCQENPKVLAVAVPAIDGSSKPDGYPTLFRATQPSEGTENNQSTVDANRIEIANYNDTGATWGLAYKRDTNDTFMAASLKPKSKIGNSGVGAIYKITSNGTLSTFKVVPDVSSSELDDYLDGRNIKYDSGIYEYIGREGLGDIEISEDDQTLYALNMYKKSIVEINTTNGDIIKSTVLLNPYNDDCPVNDVRPWALTVKGKNVYAGMVCESDITLGASIQKYNGAIIREIAHTNTLDYLRPAYNEPTDAVNGYFNNKPWEDKKVSPILTDIEFSNTNDLILSYTNRSSLMRKAESDEFKILSGDIRKMCYNADGNYTDESTAIAPTSCNSYAVQYAGNDETYYEFYRGEFYGSNYGEDAHPETAGGALAQQAGKPYITISMMDVSSLEEPGGIANLSHVDGNRVGTQALLKSLSNNNEEASVYGRKAGGLGDIELMCDPAPIEIGNYVWVDLDEDGIQNPEEMPLKDITVTLWDGTTQIGETTTDGTGHYYFGGFTNANVSTSLTSHHEYTIKVDRNQNGITRATTKDVHVNADDIRDSDARTETNDLVIDVTTSVNNDHSLDIGIVPVKIGNFVWIEDDYDGNATTGNITPVKGTTVTATCDDVEYTAITDDSGHYTISVPANVDCTCVKVPTPSQTVPTYGSSDNSVDDTTTEDNKTHDGSCTTVSVGKVDNMTLDFGFIVAIPEITIEKSTNLIDADTAAEAVELTYGDSVTWRYVVTNTGNEPLKEIAVVDDKIGPINCPSTTLAVGDSMTCDTKTSTATKLTYVNKATVSAKGELSNKTTLDDDLSHYKLLQVKIGNRVWIETDNDGDATTGSITPVAGTTVRATCNGINYTGTTNSNGLYIITVPANIGICTLKVNTPNSTTPAQGSDDNSVDDTTSEENKTHDGSGTTVDVGTVDNMTLDFGFYKKPNYFDLALTKKLTKSGTYTQGDTVKFAITVINQGKINATNIQLNDYIPTGLSLNDSKWKVSGNKATLKTPISSLAAGSRKTVYISFKVNDNFYGTEIINNAEIRSASGGTDVDSTPNSENGSVPDCNNHITSETNGKDDYDCAKITLIPSEIQPTPTPTPNPHAKPGRPLSVKTTQVENGIKLSWADNSTNETGFKIYQDNKLVAIVPANTTEYTLENLDSNTMYTIKIVAFNSSSTSSASIITFTTKDDYGWMIPAIYYMQLQ